MAQNENGAQNEKTSATTDTRLSNLFLFREQVKKDKENKQVSAQGKKREQAKKEAEAAKK